MAVGCCLPGPVLCAEGPRLWVVLLVAPLWCSPVFGIKADEVDAWQAGSGRLLAVSRWLLAVGGRLLAVGGEQACEFYHHGDTRCAIVGCEDGFMPVGFVGVVVGPWPAVPVCCNDDALRGFGFVAGNDVGGLEGCAVVSGQCGLLLADAESVLPELADDPLAALFVGL